MSKQPLADYTHMRLERLKEDAAAAVDVALEGERVRLMALQTVSPISFRSLLLIPS
jgi:hypothetical protein